METVRERILDNLKTTLESITTANGYSFDFAAGQVERWSMHGNGIVNTPAIVISPGDEEERDAPYPYEECLLHVYLDTFFSHSDGDTTATDTYLNRLQGDIKKSVLIDGTRGGNAIDTNVIGSTPFEIIEGQPYAGIIIELGIRYRHLRSDPTALT